MRPPLCKVSKAKSVTVQLRNKLGLHDLCAVLCNEPPNGIRPTRSRLAAKRSTRVPLSSPRSTVALPVTPTDSSSCNDPRLFPPMFSRCFPPGFSDSVQCWVMSADPTAARLGWDTALYRQSGYPTKTGRKIESEGPTRRINKSIDLRRRQLVWLYTVWQCHRVDRHFGLQ